MLSLLLNPKCRIPVDHAQTPIPNAVRRAEYLVERLGKSRQKIIIPTPAAAEILTVIGVDAQRYYDIVAKSRLFAIESFDQKCAIELAILNRTIFGKEDQKNSAEPYQKIKIDRQIVAILKVNGAVAIYTDDKSLANRARMCGLLPVATHELPEPEQHRQLNMEFGNIDPIPEAPGDEIPDFEGATIETEPASSAGSIDTT